MNEHVTHVLCHQFIFVFEEMPLSSGFIVQNLIVKLSNTSTMLLPPVAKRYRQTVTNMNEHVTHVLCHQFIFVFEDVNLAM
jgi:3-polyprenyl-4-hydroxybenzoate decarboxylase